MVRDPSKATDYSKLLHFCWSTSKADTASQCMYKFMRVYGDGVKESSHALTLGSDFHEIMANELLTRNKDINTLVKRLDEKPGCDPEIYSWSDGIVDFTTKWTDFMETNGFEATIEQKYAMTRDFKKADFFGDDAYIRGVFDLWGLDEKNNRLVVIDHKSSKSASSPAVVKTHNQLNLYVVMLTRLFNLKWDYAHIALHYIRHNKIVWAKLSHKEVDNFEARYLHFLSILEDRVVKAYETSNWERTPGFHCGWCSFKNECQGKCK